MGQLHSSTRGYTFVPAPCLEEIDFSHWMALAPYQKSIGNKYWILGFILLVHMPILMLVSHCFDYYSFVVNFKISILFFFFKTVLAIQIPLQFYINIVLPELTFPVLQQKAIEILIEVILNLKINLGYYWHLHNVKSSNSWTQNVFPFIQIFLNFIP